MSEYYDRQGQPITMMEWAELMEEKYAARRAGDNGWTKPEADPSRVGFDQVGDVKVSTVWLGLDHGWGGGPPLIFETMIFGGEHDQECYRYSTQAEALASHRDIVRRLQKGLPLP